MIAFKLQKFFIVTSRLLKPDDVLVNLLEEIKRGLKLCKQKGEVNISGGKAYITNFCVNDNVIWPF